MQSGGGAARGLGVAEADGDGGGLGDLDGGEVVAGAEDVVHGGREVELGEGAGPELGGGGEGGEVVLGLRRVDPGDQLREGEVELIGEVGELEIGVDERLKEAVVEGGIVGWGCWRDGGDGDHGVHLLERGGVRVLEYQTNNVLSRGIWENSGDVRGVFGGGRKDGRRGEPGGVWGRKGGLCVTPHSGGVYSGSLGNERFGAR